MAKTPVILTRAAAIRRAVEILEKQRLRRIADNFRRMSNAELRAEMERLNDLAAGGVGDETYEVTGEGEVDVPAPQ